MAMVPKIHNRVVPAANQSCLVRDARAEQRKHREAIQRMRPAIDNKWGQRRNGVRELKQASYTHVRANLKRAQLEDERAQAIENENFKLLEKLSKILERPQDPTAGTKEFAGGMRLTATQVPVIDHCVPTKTTMAGAAVEAGSLNFGMRTQQQMEIVMANHKLVKRIQMCKPTYDRQKQLDDAKERERWLWNQAIANRPLDAQLGPRHRLRPQSAPTTRQPDKQTQPQLVGTYVRRPAEGPAAAARPVRPQTARPPKLERRPSELSRRSDADKSVLRVLDLLAQQRSKITSLHDLRQQKDVLMESVYTPPTDVRAELLEANGVVINLTTSPACASSPDALVILVHGGLFMSGSPRASQHLATKLCKDLGVTVATPVMRLAPEHPYPAALDDLKAAYAHLTQKGFDTSSDSPPPSKIGIFAESSGGALAVCMLQSLIAAGEELPTCLALSSPWLDMSCEGGSFVVNEAYDLMMRKDRMQGIAKAYLAGTRDTTDPLCSPLLAPPGPAFALPPTLVHVCQNELLLDDSLTFAEHCKAAGCDITVKGFDQALHAWHTYFPIMPVAQIALAEVEAFFRTQLGLEESEGWAARSVGLEPLFEGDGATEEPDGD
uniref:Alpha/beta hydrolase fold-3 domain-containing protein n=1 Tax=Haptolina brevifila TaxID=156173 RepID=A0A7S2HMB8_9EUKA